MWQRERSTQAQRTSEAFVLLMAEDEMQSFLPPFSSSESGVNFVCLLLSALLLGLDVGRAVKFP